MIPSDPPTYKFRWPAEWSDWRGKLWSWLKESQPIPDPASFAVRETPQGRFFSLRPAGANIPYVAPRFFEIFDSSERDADGVITTAQVRLVESLLCGDVPTGITDLAVADGDKVYAHVEYDVTDGSVTGRTIAAAASVPAAASGDAYLQIGTIAISGETLTPTNDIYGPIIGCRNWFVTPLEYTLIGTGPS